MASLTQWTWDWANSWRQWSTGKSGVLQFMGSKRVRHELATGQQPTTLYRYSSTSTASSPSLKTTRNSRPPWFHQDTQPHLNLFSCILQVAEWMETGLGTISHQQLKHLSWWMLPRDQQWETPHASQNLLQSRPSARGAFYHHPHHCLQNMKQPAYLGEGGRKDLRKNMQSMI